MSAVSAAGVVVTLAAAWRRVSTSAAASQPRLPVARSSRISRDDRGGFSSPTWYSIADGRFSATSSRELFGRTSCLPHPTRPFRLFSPSRRLLPLDGRSELRLALPADAWIDVEAVGEALHRAEGAVVRRDWAAAWGPARVVQHIAARALMHGEDAAWLEEHRRRLRDAYEQGLDLAAQTCLEIGGSELHTAERTARTLVEVAPYRESGYRWLMLALDRRGNRAEALLVYDELRRRLRDALGTAPSPAIQELYRTLLG